MKAGISFPNAIKRKMLYRLTRMMYTSRCFALTSTEICVLVFRYFLFKYYLVADKLHSQLVFSFPGSRFPGARDSRPFSFPDSRELKRCHPQKKKTGTSQRQLFIK